MQTANQLARRTVARVRRNESADAAACDRDRDQPLTRLEGVVLATMGERFGHRWTHSFGDDLPQSWRADLAGLDAEQIRRGLDAVRDAGLSWPPSSPEFRAMCIGTALDRTDGAAVAARMNAVPALPEPREVWAARRRAANAGLDVAFNALGRRRKPPEVLLAR